MTEKNSNQDEPSIEEILSSIRDIISEDDEEDVSPEENIPAKTKAEPSEPVQENDESQNKDADVINPAEEVVAGAAEDGLDHSADVSDEDDKGGDDVLELTEVAPEEDSDEKAVLEGDPLAGIDLDHPSDDDLDITDSPLEQEENAEVLTSDGVDDILSETSDEDEATDELAALDTDVTDVKDEEEGLINNIAETATIGAMAKLAENIAVSRNVGGTTLEDIVRELLRPMLKEWLDDNLPDLIDRLVTKELERLAEKAVRK